MHLLERVGTVVILSSLIYVVHTQPSHTLVRALDAQTRPFNTKATPAAMDWSHTEAHTERPRRRPVIVQDTNTQRSWLCLHSFQPINLYTVHRACIHFSQLIYTRFIVADAAESTKRDRKLFNAVYIKVKHTHGQRQQYYVPVWFRLCALYLSH